MDAVDGIVGTNCTKDTVAMDAPRQPAGGGGCAAWLQQRTAALAAARTGGSRHNFNKDRRCPGQHRRAQRRGVGDAQSTQRARCWARRPDRCSTTGAHSSAMTTRLLCVPWVVLHAEPLGKPNKSKTVNSVALRRRRSRERVRGSTASHQCMVDELREVGVSQRAEQLAAR